MATAMREVTATHNSTEKESVARREFSKKLEAKDDVESYVLAKVVLNEHLELLASREPNGVLAFARSIAAQAHWAVDQLVDAGNPEHCKVPLECKRTRLFLCGLIACGWVAHRDLESRGRFAKVLQTWPEKEEGREVSEIIRKHLDSAWINEPGGMQMLGAFFYDAEMPDEGNQIYRTVFKAIARNASMEDIFALGKLLYLLNSERRKLVLDQLQIHFF